MLVAMTPTLIQKTSHDSVAPPIDAETITMM
jgi:hypothetical protein